MFNLKQTNYSTFQHRNIKKPTAYGQNIGQALSQTKQFDYNLIKDDEDETPVLIYNEINTINEPSHQQIKKTLSADTINLENQRIKRSTSCVKVLCNQFRQKQNSLDNLFNYENISPSPLTSTLVIQNLLLIPVQPTDMAVDAVEQLFGIGITFLAKNQTIPIIIQRIIQYFPNQKNLTKRITIADKLFKNYKNQKPKSIINSVDQIVQNVEMANFKQNLAKRRAISKISRICNQ